MLKDQLEEHYTSYYKDQNKKDDRWSNLAAQKFFDVFFNKQILVLSLSYILGFQWIFDLTNIISKRNSKILLRRLDTRDHNALKKTKPEIQVGKVHYPVTFYNFLAVPINWLVINFAELINFALVIAAAIFFVAVCGILEHIVRSAFKKLKESINDFKVNNLLSKHKDQLSHVAHQYINHHELDRHYRLNFLARYVPLDILLSDSQDNSKLSFYKNSVQSYLYYRDSDLEEIRVSKTRQLILSAILILPFIFVFISYRKTIKSIEQEQEKIKCIEKNLELLSDTPTVHQKMLRIYSKYNFTKDQHSIISKCLDKHGVDNISFAVDWCCGRSKDNIVLTNILKFAYKLSAHDIDVLPKILQAFERSPIKFDVITSSTTLNLINDILKKFGQESYWELYNCIIKNMQLSTHFADILTSAIHFGVDNLTQFMVIIQQVAPWEIIKSNIDEALSKRQCQTFSEPPIEKILENITEQKTEVKPDFSTSDLQVIQKEYSNIKSIGESLVYMTSEEVETKRKEAASNLDLADAKQMLLAVIRHQVKESINIFPTIYQMVYLLAILQKSTALNYIAQINNNEKDSLIVAMLAAFYAAHKNRKIDINNPSAELCKHNAKRFAPFYESMDITSGHICNNKSVREKNFNPTIIYGTISNFGFSNLNTLYHNNLADRKGRNFDLFIVDDIEEMFEWQDDAIQYTAPDDGSRLFCPQLYEVLWEYFKTNPNPTISMIKKHLNTIFPDVEYSPSMLSKWKNSLKIAKRKVEGKDYVLKDKENNSGIFALLDPTLGSISYSRWPNGIHSFLEAKHKLPVQSETLYSCGITYREVFKRYTGLIGLTNVSANQSERTNFQKIYNAKYYELPSLKPTQRVEVPNIVVSNKDDKLSALYQVIDNMLNDSPPRPVLIFCKNKTASLEVFNDVKKRFANARHCCDLSDNNAVISTSNGGMVTVAPSYMYSSLEIISEMKSENPSGIHVISTFKPQNKRLEEHLFEMSGCQGSYQYILSEDEFDSVPDEKIESNGLIKKWQTQRDNRNAFTFETNLRLLEINNLIYVFECIFFSLPSHIKSDRLNARWSELYTDFIYLLKYANIHITSAENEIDTVIYSVEIVFWQYFLNFWNKSGLSDLSLANKHTAVEFKHITDNNSSKLPFTQLLLLLGYKDISYFEIFKKKLFPLLNDVQCISELLDEKIEDDSESRISTQSSIFKKVKSDKNKQYHQLVIGLIKKHTTVNIAGLIDWALQQPQPNETAISLLKLADSLAENEFTFISILLSNINKIPIVKQFYSTFSVFNLTTNFVKKLGCERFFSLLQQTLNCPNLHAQFSALLNYAIHFSSKHFDRYMALLGSEKSWITIKSDIEDLLHQIHFETFPELPLEDVLQKFSQPGPGVEFPLEAKEIAKIRTQYKSIKNFGEYLISLSIEELDEKRQQILSDLKKAPTDERLKLELLAIIRQHIKICYGVYPYNIQMINVLACINSPSSRRIAQIKTGEGKSIVNAMLAAFFALQKRKIDINTTFQDLAIRDAKKFTPFYDSLGVTSGHICVDSASEHHFKPDVIYGVTSDFEFSILWEMLNRRSRGGRPFDIVIVDEVDSMCLDMQHDKAYVSLKIKNNKIYCSKLYTIIWDYVNATKNLTFKEFREHLNQHFPEAVFTDSMLTKWAHSAERAKQKIEGKDYVVKKSKGIDRIQIVDYQNTGAVYESRNWQHGLHSFLEVKHGLKPRVEDLTGCGISHFEYYKRYKCIFGLTGTAGNQTDRNELKKIYSIETYDSPVYRASPSFTPAHIIARNQDEKINSILRNTSEMVKSGRPALIICETIDYTKKIFALMSNQFSQVQLYNGLQEESADNILALAGEPGTITIATNTAGRGADIVPSDESEENGGLDVTMTFKTKNKRVEDQGFGRTRRQGRNGTFRYILSEDEFDLPKDEKAEANEIIQRWQTQREIDNAKESDWNLRLIHVHHLEYIFQCIFFSLPNNIRTEEMLEEWAVFYTDLLYQFNILENQLRSGTSKTVNDVYDIEIALWKMFLEFWQKSELTKKTIAENQNALILNGVDLGGFPMTKLILSLASERIGNFDLLYQKFDNGLESLNYILWELDLLPDMPLHAKASSQYEGGFTLFNYKNFNQVIPKVILSALVDEYQWFKSALDSINSQNANGLINSLKSKLSPVDNQYEWEINFSNFVSEYTQPLLSDRLVSGAN